MATPTRRRSARLNGRGTPQRSVGHKTPGSSVQLGALIERDETPEARAQPSIDKVISTPATEVNLGAKMNELARLKAPSTEPAPSRAQMHPEAVHQTMTKALDSGFKLGLATTSNTPKKSPGNLHPAPLKGDKAIGSPDVNTPAFEFKFRSHSQLSTEAQKLMEDLRDEAARIKAQMQVEKDNQDKEDVKVDTIFDGVGAAGRKIAHPRGKASRFSDVHMAAFKKMDSIANHPSSFRAKPGFVQPTQQSLKRSGSKAGLDEPERPRTASRGVSKSATALGRSSFGVSPFKSLPNIPDERSDGANPVKRIRRSEFADVSTDRAKCAEDSEGVKGPKIPRPSSIISHSLLSPTKASLARTTSSKLPTPLAKKPSMLPRSNSTKSLGIAFEDIRKVPETSEPTQPTASPSKLPRFDRPNSMRPLPPIPADVASTVGSPSHVSLPRSQSTKTLASPSKSGNISSKLPTFAGLRSILRSSRAPNARSTSVTKRLGGSMTHNSASASAKAESESPKKVDFTPSVKSRYAVKLAASSPSPSRILRSASDEVDASPPAFDSVADVTGDGVEEEADHWEDAESEIEYPVLPSPDSVAHDFSQKAKEHNRRESTEFKSIFTTLHHPSRDASPSTLTSVNTVMNKTNPTVHANKVMRSPSNPFLTKSSPSTIRRVRTSAATDTVQPFEDMIKTISHGLPGKKRRFESTMENDRRGVNEDAKENRGLSVMPQVPGGWDDSVLDEHDQDDEGQKRGGKRARIANSEPPRMKSEPKKSSTAREAAAKHAQERKGKGILSLSRLNMLARPKKTK